MKRFKGTSQKVRIVSNNICYGPSPEPDDEVEQHIIINADGRIWFSAYNFGSGFDGYEKSRSKIYKIEKESATKVLNSIARYFSTEYIEVLLPISVNGRWRSPTPREIFISTAAR